jgi:hypothetical protein
MALDTLRSILPRWVGWKRAAVDLFETSAYPLPRDIPKFFGSLVQRFNIRNGRAAKPYRDNIAEINESIATKLMPVLSSSGMALSMQQYGSSLEHDKFCLSQIPDFHGLLPKSNNVGVPIFDVRDDEIEETGTVLDGLVEKRETFRTMFNEISQKIVGLMAHA